VKVARVRIEGNVVGSLEVDGHVEITASAKIDADVITYGSISIDAGARVNGTLRCRHADFDENG
jgi:cytoskeletal protein CcmA (bactofilin family)